MSQWTHVNASIRFDGLPYLAPEMLPTEKDLGKICRWEDEEYSHWDNPDLPCGSEGSIEYQIIRNHNTNNLAAMVVVFYGDLRDYDNSEEILEYFKKITDERAVRSGILEIEIEFQRTLIYKFNAEQSKWIEVYNKKE